MGNRHKDKWTRALPWVLMGKRVALQPDLDASASMLTFGKSIEIPGQLLGHPGPPLNSEQSKMLLEELYKMNAEPAIQTSSTACPRDISKMDSATHVYVKVDQPLGLNPRFKGPYKIESRPSRSQIRVRIGSYASGEARYQTFHWDQCKIAHLREGAAEGSRENLGRKPNAKPPSGLANNSKQTDATGNSSNLPSNVNKDSGAKIQNADQSSGVPV